jgi:hypothetical protein
MARVALYGAGGSPYHHAAAFAAGGAAFDFVFPADIEAGALAAYDAFVMPGGGYLAMQGQLEPLGSSGCRAIRQYVADGGLYIGSCAGSYSPASVPASFLRACPMQADLRLLDCQIWNGWDSPLAAGLQSPGIGTLRASNAAPAHPVMAGMPAAFTITHYNGPLFSGGEVLATVAGPGEEFTPAEEFLGERAESTLVARAAEAGVANIVAGRPGDGRVVLFGSHPEFGRSTAMDEPSPAALMLTNALAWQLAESGEPERPAVPVASRAPVTAPDDISRLDALVPRITERCGELADGATTPAWLESKAALSMFGRSPADIWTASLQRIPELAAEARSAAPQLPPEFLSFRAPASWPLDGGFHGVAALLEQVDDLLAQAVATRDFVPSGRPGPYADIRDSPYHLVAGSYLAAIGRAASAALLCRAAREANKEGEGHE